ncbi:phosphoribosylaminoimidazole-succinocarboxamide synthase [Thermosipho melanesiensis]|uniref:Phosphoribosylaminoimidazole-succinocarboxamide synthase n=2 Tax=Thermosipho melanesiensis TaxID=46541 RepID=A6LMD5_THEM4|nr:phosphoribosylaminoimidazolesuccinocarboxamide synthase [Thermosipho melanesiensis]ABR31086.1 Phosphoribosylaminoimidazolesuccinocarboxamide synthase [Thermosipho melanesiensis BI429]APT74181.1 phosphoribosylaminoimidazole-succinocarboxamide synthase [Thermosipho melanesiensis]OOC36125.1 phosphoribosylaminoimidazole-succinocarboxamide synthase [Thermosipho melanesiensis]OOC36942.1 phosphoribosylaminoimidazole-succinocarboxamide synthase [Thermosipho melanesiensis]OOC37694.1 phosphoribosylam
MEGKTKIVDRFDDYVILNFKDDITAGDGEKHNVLSGKGEICAEITAITMKYLNSRGIYTQFLDFERPNKIKAVSLEMFPLEVVVRLKKAGSFIRRYGGEEGEEFKEPLVEFFIKDDEKHDPMVCKNHLVLFGICSEKQVDEMIDAAKKTASELKKFFGNLGFDLWDMKFEYGVDKDGKICLGDEISPDTLRLRKTAEIFDKDVYRKDLGDPLEKYREVLEACRSLNLL